MEAFLAAWMLIRKEKKVNFMYGISTRSETACQLRKSQSTKFPGVNWADFYADAYSVTREGNFEGKTVLQKSIGNSELARRYSLSESDVDGLLHDLNQIPVRKTVRADSTGNR